MNGQNVTVQLLTNAEIRNLNLRAQPARVLDLNADETYDIFWGGPPRTHTDFSPLTPENTETIRRIAGEWNWIARPVILMVGQHYIAAGVHSFPHGSIIGGNPGPLLRSNSNSIIMPPNNGSWSRNPVGGHFCMWYKDSRGNSGNINSAYAQSMRAAAQRAYDWAQEMEVKVEMVYRILNDIPDSEPWLKETVAQMIADGRLSGSGTDEATGQPIIDITKAMIRAIVIAGRETQSLINAFAAKNGLKT